MNPVSGVCTSGVIRWPAAAVPTVARDTTLGTAPVTLTYTVDLPAGVDPGRTYTNTAGVRRYEAVSNADDSPFVYYPSSNIDGTVVPNTGPASDNSTITIATASVGKVQQSSVNDAFGNAGNASPSTTAERATIGETITYTITATIPEGTSVVDARIVDTLDGDLVLHASPAVLVNGAPDAAWVVTAPAVGSGGTIQVDRAGTHVNTAGSGPDLVTVVIVARVSSAGGTVAGSTISNTSSFSWLPDASIGTTRVTVNGNTVTATVVEPAITLTKNENDADDIVVPNDTLTYTLVVAAGSGANRSSATRRPGRRHDPGRGHRRQRRHARRRRRHGEPRRRHLEPDEPHDHVERRPPPRPSSTPSRPAPAPASPTTSSSTTRPRRARSSPTRWQPPRRA